MSLLVGPWSPPGVSRSGVSNGNNRKNDNPLIVVPSVNVLLGTTAKIDDTTFLQPKPLGGIGSYFGDQSLMWFEITFIHKIN